MTATATITTLAEEAYDWFETATRDNGDSFTRLKNGAPEWVTEMIRDAHHGYPDMLPDDYRYKWVCSALECISDADDPEDAAHEWADAEVDVYTGRLLDWLSSNLQRIGYVDSAAEEMEITPDEGIVRMIAAGQYEECRETYGAVLTFLERKADDQS